MSEIVRRPGLIWLPSVEPELPSKRRPPAPTVALPAGVPFDNARHQLIGRLT